jgi:outer membrane protein
MRNILFAASTIFLLSGYAQAQNNVLEKGDWLLRAGVTQIDTDSDGLQLAPGTTVSADSAAGVTFNGTYMLTDNLGLELLAALPYKHDIELNGDKVGSTKHLPPTFSLQWHQPIGSSSIVPYAGVGINYTIFFDDKTQGALQGTDLSLDNSIGLAAQLGADWFLGSNWLVNLDVRYIDIDTDAKLDGTDIGSVSIDPWLYGINVGYRF